MKNIRDLQDEGKVGPIRPKDILPSSAVIRWYSPLQMCVGCEYYKDGLVKAGLAGRSKDYRSYDRYTYKCYYSSKRGLVRTNGINQYKPCPKRN